MRLGIVRRRQTDFWRLWIMLAGHVRRQQINVCRIWTMLVGHVQRWQTDMSRLQRIGATYNRHLIPIAAVQRWCGQAISNISLANICRTKVKEEVHIRHRLTIVCRRKAMLEGHTRHRLTVVQKKCDGSKYELIINDRFLQDKGNVRSPRPMTAKRCVQDLADAAFHWTTLLARCAHDVFNAKDLGWCNLL